MAGIETSGLAQEVAPGAVTPVVRADGSTIHFEHGAPDVSGFGGAVSDALPVIAPCEPRQPGPSAEQQRIDALTFANEGFVLQVRELARVNRALASEFAIGNFAMQMRAKVQQLHGVLTFLADPANAKPGHAPDAADWQRLIAYAADASHFDAEFLPWPAHASGQHQQVRS